MKTLLNAVHSPVIFMKWYRLVSFNRDTFLLNNNNDLERSKCWCRIKVKKHKKYIYYQGHDTHSVQLSVGATWNASWGGVTRTRWWAPYRGAHTEWRRNRAHGAETSSEAIVAAHPTLNLLCPNSCAFLLLLDHPGWTKTSGVNLMLDVLIVI